MVTKMNYPLGVLSAILILFVRVATLSIQLALVISTKDFAKQVGLSGGAREQKTEEGCVNLFLVFLLCF